MFNLSGRAALVTGSSRGIGRAIALQLARQGASIAINYLQNEQAAKEVQETVRSYEGNAVLIQGDISDPAQAEQVVDRAQEAFGRLDILVNNAGFNRDTLLLRMSVDDWDEVMAVNLRAVFLCTKAALKHMLRQRYGRIVNIGSVSGIAGNAGQANYAASKAGILGFTKSVARELASRGIRCNAIAPGFIETDMTSALDENQTEALLEQIPLGHLGAPSDVARLARFLAGPGACYITGQVISVDGGMRM